MLKRFSILLFGGLLSACATPNPVLSNSPVSVSSLGLNAQASDSPSGEFIDYSSTKPENHVSEAIKYAEGTLRSSLMDPDGMRLDTSETADLLKLGICAGGQDNQGNRYKLWATTISINTTDAYGTYTGNKPYTLFFKDGEVFASQQAHPNTFDERPTADGFFFPCNAVQ